MGHAELTPAEVKADVHLLGRASFTAPPGTVTTVTCPTPWVPGSEKATQQGILVQVRDLFTDPWTAPFDAVNDRHVARNDDIMPRVWNTGVDPNAATLAPGAADPHWRLIAGPGVDGPRPPFVVTEQHPGGAYFPTSDSRWIWQDAAGTADPGSSYTFRLPIDLTGYNPASVTISGAWGVDNDGTITLNGQPPGWHGDVLHSPAAMFTTTTTSAPFHHQRRIRGRNQQPRLPRHQCRRPRRLERDPVDARRNAPVSQ